jgi:hypothetical protein
MTYRVEVRSGVSDYLRGLEGFTREGRLAMHGFMDALRDYEDEARGRVPATNARLDGLSPPLDV